MSESNVAERVLDFYKVLPFNTYGNLQNAAKNVIGSNQIQLCYADLHKILENKNIQSVLDVGCGGGWFSNSVAYYYNKKVLGIDFNPKAIAIASELSQELKLNATFKVADLFRVSDLGQQFDLVSSIGVLHHTHDTLGAITSIAKVLKRQSHSRLYLGLYHRYGRAPFLKYFKDLQGQGASESELFERYSELHGQLNDTQHLYSWFRDQVLHPHETQHDLKEICEHLSTIGLELESTSINGFAPIESMEQLFLQERTFEELSYLRNVKEKRYFPGFFMICAKWRET